MVPESKRTKGLAALANHSMGRATQQATRSGCSWPMRLGTNSPKIIVVNVIAVTTRPVAVMAAAVSAMPQPCNAAATPLLKADSPTIPLRTPIDVIPTCTVDKNWLGFPKSSKAACAPLSPASIKAVRRALRLPANANSDMAKTPLRSVKKTISSNSMDLERK